MVFSFNLPDWLLIFTDNPAYVTTWAAFGVPLVMFACALFFGILSAILRVLKFSVRYRSFTAFLAPLFSAMFITWIIGFIVSIILLFCDIEAMKMMLIWSVLFISSFVFCFIHQKTIKAFLGESDN